MDCKNTFSLDFADPVTKPVVWTYPSSGAVEYVGNMTFACQVEGGTRLVYQWLKNGKPVCTSSTYSFSPQNNTLHISPVTKEDIGNYSCLVKNPVSEMESNIIMPTIYCKLLVCLFILLMNCFLESSNRRRPREYQHQISFGFYHCCSSGLFIIASPRPLSCHKICIY